MVGAGTIGSGWQRVFERAGLETRIWDIDRSRSTVSTLRQAVADAVWIQEAGPEHLPTKQALFADIDRLTAPEAILASSTSALPMTAIARDTQRPERCLVAHPTNPPDLVPLVEIVPGERTSPETTQAAVDFLGTVGQTPIVCRKETYGFVLNRLQMALLREALSLHRQGVAGAADIDLAVTDGLAMRWAFLGPFAVEHTNAASLEDDLTKFKDVIGQLFAALSNDTNAPDASDVARLNDELEQIARGRTHAELLDHRDRMIERLRELKRSG